ncbi:MAG: restriction endonuclease, partial [Anaerolineae bacterium]
MAWFRSHHLRKLSPDEFEQLVYWLARRCGEFSAVQWYGGVHNYDNNQGRDIVAHKHTDAGLERWYIQCKRHTRINYATLRNELNTLSKHAAESPGFAPHVIVFATACDIPPRAKNKATVYARASGLPAPLYWDHRELDNMLTAQPETEKEFFGQSGYPLKLRTQITNFGNWSVAIILGTVLLLAIRAVINLPLLPHEATPALTPTPTQEPTAMPVAVIPPTPTNTPTPTP